MLQPLRKFNVLFIGYILINILQSIFTPLIPDEAYYWVYSQNLSWGFFDHPPMVAYLIKLGNYLFSDELGVRIITVALNALMILLIWSIIPDKNKKHPYAAFIFFGILFSIPLFHVYSFITTPDAPLLFSFALYLLTLKKLGQKENLLNALLFGLAAALLLYSKYHGGILILLSIAFKPKLLKQKATYIAGFFALTLTLPHIFWLYNNDFITFKYHLFERTDGSFKINQVLEYLLGSLGVLNPVLIILFIYFLIKNPKTINKEDHFYFKMFYGFIGFFFLYSFRARIEAHWVAAAYIPLTIMVYNLAINNSKFLKTLKYSIGIVAVLIFFLRIIPLVDLPINSPFHSKKKAYYQEIKEIASGKAVMFLNSYQEASKYSFYTKENTHSLNSLYHRKNQYDLLNQEKEFNNKSVFLVCDHKTKQADTIILKSNEQLFFKTISHFPMISKLKASLTSEDTNTITIQITNPYSYSIDFQRKDLPYKLALAYSNGQKRKLFHIKQQIPKLKSKESYRFKTDFTNITNEIKKVNLAIKVGHLPYQVIKTE